MINVENISKSFGPQSLLDRISFKINPGERIGLVGRNGHGKTTILRLLTGEEAPDEGEICIPKHYRIGHLKQHLGFTKNTIIEECLESIPGDPLAQQWKAEKILSGLGFSQNDMDRTPGEFSGGYQVRLNLAKVLVSKPDLLLLDEPSNYLDITSIRWIESFLHAWPNELVLITHDRTFMDRVITHTLGIHRRKIRKITGATGKYYEQIARDEEIYEKTRINEERRRKETEIFIDRFRAKARLATLVQSRVKTLEKLEPIEHLEKIKDIGFSFQDSPFHGRIIIEARDLSFSYTKQHPLIHGFNLAIGPKDRICIMGKNGRGKTTLLRLLAGSLNPDQGEIVNHPSAMTGVFEQTNIARLHAERTIEEELLASSGKVDKQGARGILGALHFEGDAALKKIRVLSGGEKSRVMLAKLLVSPLNILLLDEPTNHLDMETCDVLLEAINRFDGALVMVTHNETFLHTLAERLIVFDQQKTEVFEGGYQRFLDKVGWEAMENTSESMNDRKKKGQDRAETRRIRSKIISQRSGTIKPLEQRISQVEDEIDSHEKKIEACTSAMQEASLKGDGKQIAELSKSIHSSETTIEGLFDEMERLSIKLEENQQYFDQAIQDNEG
ncbi:MAG: ABC-F family ATP-binding cassette domain-containing protein [Thermodesulfobacteriota bacterium]|nr:ABC-F family ATP-binding cassette domain-containing protein [Thermodesulfobacteriota bacterium]